MTLKEKFKEILTAFWINDWEDKCEKIADEFAIGFAEWLNSNAFYAGNECYGVIGHIGLFKLSKVLEIYKKEKGL